MGRIGLKPVSWGVKVTIQVRSTIREISHLLNAIYHGFSRLEQTHLCLFQRRSLLSVLEEV